MAGIILSIEVDDKGTVKVKQFADETKKAFNEMKKGPEEARGPMASVQESWAGLTAKVAVATAVIYGVTRAFSSFVEEAAEAEQIENRLRFALETTGYTWQYAKSAVDEFAQSVQESTRFSDEQARQSLTDVMMYTRDFAKAQDGARLAMDMSIRTGKDLGSTSRLIGMAMSGNAEMLGLYIPELRNLDDRLGSNATNADKAAYAMKILQEKFGGTAQADVKSYAGTVAQFKNAWSDLKEEIGMGLLPVLKDVFEWTTKVINSFRQLSPETASTKASEAAIEKFKGRIVELKEILAQPGLLSFQKESITNQIKLMEEAIRKFEVVAEKRKEAQKVIAAQTKKDLFVEKPKEKEIDIVKEVQAAIEAVTRAEEERGIVALARHDLMESGWSKEKDIIDQVRDEIARLERETNEWGEITVARQELIEAGWTAQAEAAKKAAGEQQAMWNNLGQSISDIWTNNMARVVKDAKNMKEILANLFQGMADVFINAVAKMITEWLLFESITGGGKKFLGGGSGLGQIIGAIGGLIGLKEGGIVSGWKPIAAFQEGGVITRPTLGMIGEGGPEAVVPLKNGKIPVETQGGGGNTYNIYIKAWDSKSVADMVEDNPEPFLKVVHRSTRAGGLMKNTIRGAY